MQTRHSHCKHLQNLQDILLRDYSTRFTAGFILSLRHSQDAVPGEVKAYFVCTEGLVCRPFKRVLLGCHAVLLVLRTLGILAGFAVAV